MLKPQIFETMKHYTKEQFVKDLIAGIIVAVVALPLSIALALASGVKPEQGLYTAIIAGFVISFLGGSRVQISGPTAAFATIVAGVVAKNGMEGLIIATIIAGIILILMGVLKLGNLIKYIPHTITTGFTSGIAITILLGQIKDFFGLTFEKAPIETVEKVEQIVTSIGTINLQALAIGGLSLTILVLWPKVNKSIPASLIAVIVASLLVKAADLNVNTIGSLYEISNNLPVLNIPQFNFTTVKNVMPDAFTIAVLAAIESLLSCVVSDGMIGSKHDSNTELVALGTGNIFSGIFGGIPATGAIARTAANVKSGGRTPIAGIIHAVVLGLILVVLMPYAALIPMSTIAAILFIVAYNMSEWSEFVELVKNSPKSDIIVLVLTFVLTVAFDLVVAIEVGIILSALLFMKRMSEVAEIHSWKYIEDENVEENLNLRIVPKNTLVYEISGPMFFAAAGTFARISTDKSTNVIILRMGSVPAMDATGLRSLQRVWRICEINDIKLIFSHVQEQPMSVMRKSKFDNKIGVENFCDNIDQALQRAEELSKR